MKTEARELIYDEEKNVWIHTGRVFTMSEQVIRFKNEYANWKTLNEWIQFRDLFLFHKNVTWKEIMESNPQINTIVHNCWGYLYYHKPKMCQYALDLIAEYMAETEI